MMWDQQEDSGMLAIAGHWTGLSLLSLSDFGAALVAVALLVLAAHSRHLSLLKRAIVVSKLTSHSPTHHHKKQLLRRPPASPPQTA